MSNLLRVMLRFEALNFGKTRADVYQELPSDPPIYLNPYQVMSRYMGTVPRIDSGGPSEKNDLQQG
jgi:hypothetical protein